MKFPLKKTHVFIISLSSLVFSLLVFFSVSTLFQKNSSYYYHYSLKSKSELYKFVSREELLPFAQSFVQINPQIHFYVESITQKESEDSVEELELYGNIVSKHPMEKDAIAFTINNQFMNYFKDKISYEFCVKNFQINLQDLEAMKQSMMNQLQMKKNCDSMVQKLATEKISHFYQFVEEKPRESKIVYLSLVITVFANLFGATMFLFVREWKTKIYGKTHG